MAITPLPIANGFYVSDSLPVSAQECLNWYVNQVQAPALNQETLFGTPGKVEKSNTGVLKQVNRGSWTFEGVPYFVNGTGLWRFNREVNLEVESFNVEFIGTIEGEGRVSMSDNGTQLCVMVPGGEGYIFTTNPDTLQVISDLDFRANGNPQMVTFIDGFFLFTTDTKKFIVSAINDGLSYNALDFGAAESDPDAIVAPIVFRNQVFIWGTETGEGFQNAAQVTGADFPFQRTGVFLGKGVDAPFSLVSVNDTMMFIGSSEKESPAIWASQGGQPTKVSTTAIDSILQTFSQDEIRESFAWAYAQKGAYFVGFSLPTTTLVVDTITGRWHERKSQVTDSQGVMTLVRSRINSLVAAYGRIFVGDSQDGRIGELDPDTYTEYGNPIIRRVATQPFQNNMQEFFVPWVELTMEAGVGNEDVPDPKIRMDRSLDGKVFKFERTRRVGKIGEYTRRTIWRRIGRAARFEVFRFTLSDAVKPVIIQLTAKIEGGQ